MRIEEKPNVFAEQLGTVLYLSYNYRKYPTLCHTQAFKDGKRTPALHVKVRLKLPQPACAGRAFSSRPLKSLAYSEQRQIAQNFTFSPPDIKILERYNHILITKY
jgi:hypothetical protein